MKILYKKILVLELWHDYFFGQPDPPELRQTDYQISELLALVPTQKMSATTAQLALELSSTQSRGRSLCPSK